MTGPEQQLELALGPFRNQRLFSDHFLADRLPDWPAFAQLDAAELFDGLRGLWRAEAPGLEVANEAQTEERWVQPLLHALGFAYTVQAGVPVGLNRRQPDYALFLSDTDRRTADSLDGVARYERAAAVADAKRFDRPLDRRAAGGALSEDPVAQIINYLSITRRPWGLLTNGRLWRLYSAEADLISGACYEVDLIALLEAGDAQAFRYFAAFFASAAFTPDVQGRSFLDRALSESQANAVQVGAALERQVFSAVPLIAEGCWEKSRATIRRSQRRSTTRSSCSTDCCSACMRRPASCSQSRTPTTASTAWDSRRRSWRVTVTGEGCSAAPRTISTTIYGHCFGSSTAVTRRSG